MANPKDMQDPSAAFKNNPRTSLLSTLSTEGWAYVQPRGEPGRHEFARAHEQHMRVKGQLQLGDEAPISFEGWGLRDHSWGPRFWQATPSYRWITSNFGDDLGMIVTTNGQGQGKGLFQKGDELVRIEEARLETVYDRVRPSTDRSGQICDRSGGPACIEGRVKGYIPLRTRRPKKYACGRGNDGVHLGWRASGLRSQ